MASEQFDPATELTDSTSTDKSGRRFALPTMSTKTKVILGVSSVVIIVIGYFVLQRFLPEWWARSMSTRIDGSFTSGTMYGLFFGIVGSTVPLILALLAYFSINTGPRRILSWALAALSLVLLIPNLLTLAVVIGNGSGARMGQRLMDIGTPGFRGATLVGVIVGVLIGIAADAYLVGRRRQKAKQIRTAQG